MLYEVITGVKVDPRGGSPGATESTLAGGLSVGDDDRPFGAIGIPQLFGAQVGGIGFIEKKQLATDDPA